MTAVLTRRSEHVLAEPAPGDQEFKYLLMGAANSPDHGRLRPWRWVLLRGAAREDLGARLAADAAEDRREHVAGKALRAPLLASLVFAPRGDHKVPEWEQMAATSAVAQSLMLLLHSRGYGSIWRTGPGLESESVRSLLGLAESERLLGWLYVGTPVRTEAQVRRPLRDVSNQVTALVSAGSASR